MSADSRVFKLPFSVADSGMRIRFAVILCILGLVLTLGKLFHILANVRKKEIFTKKLTGYKIPDASAKMPHIELSHETSNPYIVESSVGPRLELLPNLTALRWPEYQRPKSLKTVDEIRADRFGVVLSEPDIRIFQALLELFRGIMIELGLNDKWFLMAGTLVGSMRHHDFVPWDDDVDVSAPLQYRGIINMALKKEGSISIFDQGIRDKIYFSPLSSSWRTSYRFKEWPWAWPALDICYFLEKEKFSRFRESKPEIYIDTEHVFPVVYRPFGMQWYPAPRRPIEFTTGYFKNSKPSCTSSWWSHTKEAYIVPITIPCRDLAKRYPLVNRCPVITPSGDGDVDSFDELNLVPVDEYLVDINGVAIHSIRVLLPPNEANDTMFAHSDKRFLCPAPVVKGRTN